MPEEGYVPDLAPGSLGTEFYFAGRIDRLEPVIEERTSREGESFTSRQVALEMYRMDWKEGDPGPQVLNSWYGMPRWGKVNPNAQLGQLALHLAEAGTPIATAKTAVERKAAMKKLEGNIYVTLGRNERARGSERDRLYLYPIKLMGHGIEYDKREVEEFIKQIEAAEVKEEGTGESPFEPTPSAEVDPPADGEWLIPILDNLRPYVEGKTVVEASVALGNAAREESWPDKVLTLIATGKLITHLQTAGLVTVGEDGVLHATPEGTPA